MIHRQQSLSLRLLILLMATVAIFLLISNRVEAGVPTREPVPHRVVAGDSLWDLASELRLHRDIRAVINEIETLNGLSSSVIRPGQMLLLPAA